jgi:hypothetical protein
VEQNVLAGAAAGPEHPEARLLREAHQMVGLATESRTTLAAVASLFQQYLDHATALMNRCGPLDAAPWPAHVSG